MKKGIILLMVVLIAALSGCSFGGNNAPASNNTKSDQNGQGSATVAADENDQPGFNEDEIVKNIKVTSYTYSSYSYNYLLLVLKNNSKFNCKFEASVDLYDAKGNIVETKSQTVNAFAAGTEVMLKFDSKDKFKKYEYQFSASELTYYTAVTQDLKTTSNIATDKAIVSVTNNGKKAAMWTKANVIFFKGKKVVYSNLTYIGDSKNEIKPGKTQRGQVSCYEKFDNVKVYVDSYAKANES